MIDPLELARETEKIVCRGSERKYYRFRPARFYMGIATADCVGCNLRCVFCWSHYPRDNPQANFKFYKPEDVVRRLENIARRHGFKKVRISGNEPTIGREHLLNVLEIVPKDLLFILETNGVLLGASRSYVRELSNFENLHVRVSFKGTDESEFRRLTLAKGFDFQVKAVKNLFSEGVSFHVSLMCSFSPKAKVQQFCEMIQEIAPGIYVEMEHVVLYPHVKKRLEEHGLKPIL